MLKPLWAARTKSGIDRGGDNGRPLNVLVVDDDPDLCRLLETALVALGGYKVGVANGAKGALLAIDARETPFDGIFLDIQMPGTSGIELCAIIRATPGYRSVPIIMLTAMAEQQYLRDAFAAGASDYITKPFDFDEIRAKLSRERRRTGQRETRELVARQEAGCTAAPGKAGQVIRDLQDPILIPSVARCIGREAFDNYAVKVAARPGTEVYLRATKIVRVFDLFSSLETAEFQAAVVEIAQALSVRTALSGDVTTYSGNGVFLSLSVGASDLKLAALSESVRGNPRLAALTGPEHRLRLIVGREIRLAGSRVADVQAATQAAIDAAETAETRNFGWRSYRDWLSACRSVGREQRRIREAGYEQALNDILSESERSWK